MASTAQVNRLRALLLAGGDADRHTARGALTIAALSALARRRPRGDASRAEADAPGRDPPPGHCRARRRTRAEPPTASSCRPWSTTWPRPDRAVRHRTRSAPPRPSSASPTLAGAATKPHSQRWPEPARCPPAAARTVRHRLNRRRRPSPEQGDPHDRGDPHAQLRANARLRRAPDRRGPKLPARSGAASLDDYGRAGQVGLFAGNGEGRPRCLATRWPV